MGSEARIAEEVSGTADAVAVQVEQVLHAEKCQIDQKSPDGRTLRFTTRKTMLSWELEGEVVVTSVPQGSRIDLLLNTHHNRPTALMDGKKNEKSAKKLMEKFTAAAR
jgi:hypothetical protein